MYWNNTYILTCMIVWKKKKNDMHLLGLCGNSRLPQPCSLHDRNQTWCLVRGSVCSSSQENWILSCRLLSSDAWGFHHQSGCHHFTPGSSDCSECDISSSWFSAHRISHDATIHTNVRWFHIFMFSSGPRRSTFGPEIISQFPNLSCPKIVGFRQAPERIVQAVW